MNRTAFRKNRAASVSAAALALALALLFSAFRAPSQDVFADAKATGSLTVKIKPKAAKQDGARWRVDGGAWKKSGRTVSGLSVGQHTVTFKTIAGWDTPNQKTPTIADDQTATLTGKYVLSVVGPTTAFSADPTSGVEPLDVQFTDESMPGTSPIASWEWDFENDGVVDSTEQHPEHTYSTAGDYTVKLRVVSSSGSDALTQLDFIEVLPVVGPTAAFSADPTRGLAPLLVQFTDESIPGTSPITSWAWDFENDGVVDSTEQNPAHTYLNFGEYDVTLTVTSAAGPDSVTLDALINTGTIMLPGDVPLEMVWIPAGSFMMGRTFSQRTGEYELDSSEIESPRHQVTFANGFLMGKYEVTQAQWLAVMGTYPSSFPGDLSRPVETVSWDAAQTFISAVNALGQGTFRLPSEAQWEYACRAGSNTRFYWGNDLTYTQIGTYAWYFDNGSSTTHPVGQKPPNAWGPYDMSGNAEEWCEDWYHSDYTGAPADGSAWVSPTGLYRVVRGGGWEGSGDDCRSASRGAFGPSSSDHTIGFRLAK